ncbi:MAG: glycosidase [Sphingobium sp. 66-54]|nr:MAG: glycosidase [Sphingobium sp. 66-54]
MRRKAADQEAARRGPPVPTAIADQSRLTEVELTWIEQRLEHWIRFGRIAQDRILTRKTRVVGFRPGAIFAFVRWAASDFGTIVSRIDVVRAIAPGDPYTTLPFVRPGGDILLHVESWPKVQQVLAAIDAVEAAGVDPCDAAVDHWRHVHNRIAAGHQPRPYTMERHRAWLKRREIEG